MELLGDFGIFRRDLKLLTGAVVILEVVVLHGEHVDETVEIRTRIDRELHESNLLTVCLLEGSLGLLPVGLLVVKLVNCHYQRNAVTVGIA